MEHRKRSNGKEHEFVQITVQHRSGFNRPTTQLITDRSVKEDDTGVGDSKRTSSLLSTSSVAPVSSPPLDSSSSMPPAAADDKVHCGSITRLLENLKTCVTLRTLIFNDEAFPITSLAVLLLAVCLDKPDYKANESQCYWYANTIYSAANLLFHGMETVDPIHDKSRGKYLRFSIRQSDSAQTVITKYHSSLELYKETADEASSNITFGNPPLTKFNYIQNERVRIFAEQQKTAREESDRRREESERQREESDRQREESERQREAAEWRLHVIEEQLERERAVHSLSKGQLDHVTSQLTE
jgi:hypothetical protein